MNVFVNLHLIGSIKCNKGFDWSTAFLLTEGGLGKTGREEKNPVQCKKKGKKMHHAPQLSRFGIITGKSVVRKFKEMMSTHQGTPVTTQCLYLACSFFWTTTAAFVRLSRRS